MGTFPQRFMPRGKVGGIPRGIYLEQKLEKERREEEGMFGAMKPVDPYRNMRKKDAKSI